MSTVKRVTKNSLMKTISTVITKLLSLVFVITIARHLGNELFGKYSFVFALLSFFAVFTEFGMDALVIREVAKDKGKSNAFLINSMLFKGILSLISWAMLIVLIFVLRKEPKVSMGIMIAGLCLLPDSWTSSMKAVFSAHERMELNTFIEVLLRSIVVGLGLSVVFLHYSLMALFCGSFIASVVTFLFALVIYKRNIGRIEIAPNRELFGYFIRTSYVFALTGVFVSLYCRSAPVMLSIFKGYSAVGWYSAASNLTDSLLFIPAAIAAAVYPVLSRCHTVSPEKFHKVYEKTFKVLLLLALPLAVAVNILAERVIIFIYKSGFSNSIVVLRILIWQTAIVFLNALMSAALYSANKQKIVAFITGLLVVVNIILNYFFISKYSYVGASAVAVITEIIAFILCFHFVSRYIYRVKPLLVFFKSLLATFVMAGFIYSFRSYNLLLVVPMAIVVYALSIFALKVFSEEDRRFIKELMPLVNR